jgi:hypothetical protein
MNTEIYHKATELIEKITDAETALNDLEVFVERGSLKSISLFNSKTKLEDRVIIAGMGFDESILTFVQGLLEKRLEKLTKEFESL